MKKQSLLLALILSVTTGNAQAALQTGLESSSISGGGSFNLNLSLDGIYVSTRDMTLEYQYASIDGVAARPDKDQRLSFAKGEHVALEFLKSGAIVVSVLLDPSEVRVAPEKIAITKEEFERSDLRFVKGGDAALLAAKYSSTPETEVASRRGAGSRRGRMHYMGAMGCVAYVLRQIGWPGGRSGNGVDITRTLRGYGWSTVSCSNPPRGAVASWSGGSGAGHTAIWNGSCWAYDIACGDPGSRYRLKDCVAKR